MTTATNPSYSYILRVQLGNGGHSLAKIITLLSEYDADIRYIHDVASHENTEARDITINTRGVEHTQQILLALESLEKVELINVVDRTMALHEGGKIQVVSKMALSGIDELSRAYTPGVARVCMAINKDQSKAHAYTIKKNTVAIVSDGTAVLGLGDIGPEAAMPVMEGKAMLFKEFANVDGFPICLGTKDTEEIIQTILNIAPGFGGINLEDISAPRCFEIEQRLIEELDIPVFHDDQHGTAVVLIAGIINALKVVNKKPEDIKVVVAGVGAAGTACTNMLLNLGVKDIIGCDRKGALHKYREDLNSAKTQYMKQTNPTNAEGPLKHVIKGSDVFIGLSGPDVLNAEDIKTMNKDAIVFAMSNPIPEIMPEAALPHVAIMATGRSDYPNQINNVLCFPGIFRGCFDSGAVIINETMKMAAAKAIAQVIEPDELNSEYIIPSVFNEKVAPAVAEAVGKAALATGATRQ